MLRLGKDLGLTLSQVMDMTTTEFLMWAAFYKLEAEETKKAMRR
jgi:hypothetical protein